MHMNIHTVRITVAVAATTRAVRLHLIGQLCGHCSVCADVRVNLKTPPGFECFVSLFFSRCICFVSMRLVSRRTKWSKSTQLISPVNQPVNHPNKYLASLKPFYIELRLKGTRTGWSGCPSVVMSHANTTHTGRVLEGRRGGGRVGTGGHVTALSRR